MARTPVGPALSERFRASPTFALAFAMDGRCYVSKGSCQSKLMTR